MRSNRKKKIDRDAGINLYMVVLCSLGFAIVLWVILAALSCRNYREKDVEIF